MFIAVAIAVLAVLIVSIAAMAHVLIWTGMVVLGRKAAVALYILEIVVAVILIRQQITYDEECIASGLCDGPVGVFDGVITGFFAILCGVVLILNAVGLWFLYRQRATQP